jgi:hypothetical protein
LFITDIDASGNTALLLAVKLKKVRAIHLLLGECGASTAETDGEGLTVWNIASQALESRLEENEDEDEEDSEPETLPVILALCEYAAPPTYLDQLLTSANGRIAPDATTKYDLAKRAWRDSRLDAWQASWLNALGSSLLPRVLIGLVSEYRGLPLLSDMLLGGLGGDPMFYGEEDDDDMDEGLAGDEGNESHSENEA